MEIQPISFFGVVLVLGYAWIIPRIAKNTLRISTSAHLIHIWFMGVLLFELFAVMNIMAFTINLRQNLIHVNSVISFVASVLFVFFMGRAYLSSAKHSDAKIKRGLKGVICMTRVGTFFDGITDEFTSEAGWKKQDNIDLKEDDMAWVKVIKRSWGRVLVEPDDAVYEMILLGILDGFALGMVFFKDEPMLVARVEGVDYALEEGKEFRIKVRVRPLPVSRTMPLFYAEQV